MLVGLYTHNLERTESIHTKTCNAAILLIEKMGNMIGNMRKMCQFLKEAVCFLELPPPGYLFSLYSTGQSTAVSFTTSLKC